MFTLKGYESVKISDSIELPKIVDLIRFPFYSQASFDDAYKEANDDLKFILNQVPLKNDKSYVSVDCFTYFLTPNVMFSQNNNWKLDCENEDLENSNNVHILFSEATSSIKFIPYDTNLSSISRTSKSDVEMFVNNMEHSIAMRCKSNKFISYSGAHHINKLVPSIRDEFMFVLKINESNNLIPNKYDEAIQHCSYVFNSTRNKLKSIEQRNDKETVIVNIN